MTENPASDELVNRLVLQERKEEALNVLYQMICKCLKNGDFLRAEKLRDRIYEIDSMALNVIIKTNDLIDNARACGIDKFHRDIWKEFYDSLSSEEASAFFYDLREVSFNAGHTVLAQGKVSGSLFFIDKGDIKVSCTVKGKEIFLDTLRPGLLFGLESFFHDSVSTFSFVAVSEVILHRLDKNILKKWDDTLPLLTNKLTEFCSKQKSLEETLDIKRQDRRVYERVPASGLVKFQILNAEGRSVKGDFKGKLMNVSKGGLAFLIKTNKETAHLLLGRSLRLGFVLRSAGGDQRFSEAGSVTAVQFLPLFSDSSNDYSIHIRCDLHLHTG